MKIIISHDIDHIHPAEHLRDGYIPKYFVRNFLHLLLNKCSVNEYFARWQKLFSSRLNNLNELMDYDEKHHIPSTFFLAVSNGLGLSYSIRQAERIFKDITHRKFDTGVHGIAFDRVELVRDEFERFTRITGSKPAGIRTHYLRFNHNTPDAMSSAGYTYDCSVPGLKKPWRAGLIWEIPLSVMDCNVLDNPSVSNPFDFTVQLIEKAKQMELPYFSILFHDNYFYSGFTKWKKWYMDVIHYCIEHSYRFISYKDAVLELNQNYNNG